MALKDLALLAKLQELNIETRKIVKNFDKSERHVLSAEIRQTVSEMQQLVIRAAKEQLYERKVRRAPEATFELLRQCDVKLEFFKFQIDAACELRLVPPERYQTWLKLALEAGGLLGGWLKTTEETLARLRPAPARQASLV